MSVIDAAVRISHCSRVLTHDEILADLREQISSGAFKSADVARRLKIAPARVTEMVKGTRRIQPQEMAHLAAFLGTGSERDTAEVEVLHHWRRIPSERQSQVLSILETFAGKPNGSE